MLQPSLPASACACNPLLVLLIISCGCAALRWKSVFSPVRDARLCLAILLQTEFDLAVVDRRVEVTQVLPGQEPPKDGSYWWDLGKWG